MVGRASSKPNAPKAREVGRECLIQSLKSRINLKLNARREVIELKSTQRFLAL